ncbi:MAG: hypothetical protein HXY29_14185 [Rhodocyclaceae bacterium]|nr:hypothetical protein [Rhodocyclaceae bacterium]
MTFTRTMAHGPRVAGNGRRDLAARENRARRLASLVPLLALLGGSAAGLQAYTVDYAVSGSFGSPISGSDPLNLSGKSFLITGSLSTTATPTCNAGKGYSTSTLKISIAGGSPLTIASGCVTIDAVNSQMTVSGNVTVVFISVPFSATAKLPPGTLPSSVPFEFGSAAMQAGSTATYGDTPTTLNISGTVSATTTAPNISASPSSLSFTMQQGGALPSPKTTVVSTSGSTVTVTATASTSSGGNWLQVSPGSGSTPATFTVSVILGSLTAGVYNGNVRFTSSQAKNSPINVPVTLTVNPPAPTISASPSSFAFSYQQLGSAPPSQGLTISAINSGPLAYSISVSTSSGGNWLSVSPGGGTTGSTSETVSVNVAGLSPNVYSGTITVTAAGAANSPLQLPVTLTVTAAPNLTASPGSVAFAYTIGGSVPAGQTVAVGSTGSALSFSVSASTSSGGAWLSAAGGGTTPSNVTVSVNAGVLAGLGAGTYNGSVTITSGGAGNSPLTVPVSLTVSALPLLTVSPASLVFAYQTGGSVPGAQPVSVGSSGSALTFSVSASTSSGGAWLAASGGGTTPGVVSVSLNAGVLSGLGPGTYNGSVTITSAGAGNSPLAVPVSLTVSAQPLIVYGPSSLFFAFAVGGSNPAPQNISLSSSGAPLNFTVSTSASWLSASPPNGTTPGNLSVSVNPSGLGIGTFNGSVTITAAGAGNSPVTVPVTLTVSGVVNLTATPASLSFLYRVGRPRPSAQTISVSAAGASVAFSASTSGGTWLSATPGGTTPTNVTVSVDPTGLTEGAYNGTVTISSSGATNSPLTIPVTLRVTQSATLVAEPETLSFAYQIGDKNLVQRANVVLTSSTGSLIRFSTSSSAEPWLSVAPPDGQTPGTIVVSIDATGLVEGVYTGSIEVSGVGAANSPLLIPVTLTITVPDPAISVITDAASLLQGPVAPASFVTLWGDWMGPEEPVSLQLTPDGTRVATELAEVQVFFDQTPAPLLLVQARQINAIAPYYVGQRSKVKVHVVYRGRKSNEIELPVAAAAPAIFTSDQTGVGQGAILNQDNVTPNDEAHPAEPGSVIVIFAEGGGQTNPPGLDGLIAGTDPLTLPRPALPVSVLVDGVDAEVLYAGAAPLSVAGSLQINAVLPLGTRPGAVPIVVKVGSFESQPGVTVWVR